MIRSIILAIVAPLPVLTAQTVSTVQQDPQAKCASPFEREPVPYCTVLSRGIATADVDGDGRLDLLIGALGASAATASGLRYYRNRGDGTFEDRSETHVVGGLSYVSTFAVVDIDLDGDADVVGTGMLFRNTSGMLVRELLAYTPTNRICIAAGDVDGDGDVDLFYGVGFSGGPSQQDQLLLNNGSGAFQSAPSSALPIDNDTTQDAKFVDVDNDGDLDLVLAIRSQGPTAGGARLYLNDGTGNFTDASANLGAPPEDGLSVFAADFDGDGDMDVVLGTGADNFGVEFPARYLRNTGGGMFALDNTMLPAVLASTSALAAADLDGDGDLDLLLADGVAQARQQRVYRNDGTHFTDVTASWLADEQLFGVAWATGDFDGDGRVDAALVQSSATMPGRVRVWLNHGGSTFLDLTPSQLPPSLHTMLQSARFADIDGDGDLDVFLPDGYRYSTAGMPQLLLRNQGHGRFTDDSTGALPATQYNVLDAAFADVDGDGDLDLLLGTEADVILWRNDGSGHFTAPPAGTMPPAAIRVSALTVGDFDGDGDVDIFAGSPAFSTQDELLRNDGTGRFTRDLTAVPGRSRGTGVRSSVALDHDADGDLDLIVCIDSGGSTGTPIAYVNNGTGVFTVGSSVFSGNPPTDRLQTFDADGDGDLDLLLSTSSSTSILLDQGSTFVAAQPPGVNLAAVSAARLFDFDGDGDLDICVRWQGRLLLLLHDQGFRFHQAAVDLADSQNVGSIEGADLDGDGDADFLGFSQTQDLGLLMGRRVQLHAPWVARVGAPWELRFSSLPWAIGELRTGVFMLNTSALVPALPLPFGRLGVDPRGAILATGTPPRGNDPTNPAGLSLRLQLPNAPALAGLPLFAQMLALTDNAVLLSNCIADEIH